MFCIDAGELLIVIIAKELGVGKQTFSDWKKSRSKLQIIVQTFFVKTVWGHKHLKPQKTKTLYEPL